MVLIWIIRSLECVEFTNNSNLSVMSSGTKCGLRWTPVGRSAGWAGRVVAMAMWRDAPCFASLHYLHQLETRPRCGNTHPCATHTADTARTRSSRYFVRVRERAGVCVGECVWEWVGECVGECVRVGGVCVGVCASTCVPERVCVFMCSATYLTSY